jgi:hypothetical protein
VAEEWYYERSSSLTAWSNSDVGADGDADGDSSPRSGAHSPASSSSSSPIDIADCAVGEGEVSDTTRLLVDEDEDEAEDGAEDGASLNSMGTKHMKQVKGALLEASRKKAANPLVKGLTVITSNR